MVDCATGEYGKSPYPNNGCNGGLMESAFTYSSKGSSTVEIMEDRSSSETVFSVFRPGGSSVVEAQAHILVHTGQTASKLTCVVSLFTDEFDKFL